MASEWAAMATVPNGATIRVLTTCAEPINKCCSPIGAPILKAVPTVFAFGLKEPERPTSESICDFTNKNQSIRPAVISMATPVPIAAPITPKLNIYINR